MSSPTDSNAEGQPTVVAPHPDAPTTQNRSDIWRRGFAVARPALFHVALFTLFFLGACVLKWDIATNLSSALENPGDPLLMSRWVYRTIEWLLGDVSGSIFDIGFYYPLRGTWVYTDHLFAEALLSLPVAAFTREPLAFYNFAALMTIALSGYTMFLLVREVTGSPLAAFWAGVAYLIIPQRFVKIGLGHLNLVVTEFLPLVLFAVVRWARARNIRAAVLAGVAFGIHGLAGAHVFVWSNPIVGAAILAAVVGAPRGERRRALLQAAVVVAVAALVLAPLYLGYYNIYGRLGLSYSDQEPGGAPLNRFFNPPPENWFYAKILGHRVPYDIEQSIFWGVSIPLFFFVALGSVARRGWLIPLKTLAFIALALGIAFGLVFAYRSPAIAVVALVAAGGIGIAFRTRLRATVHWLFGGQPRILWLFVVFAIIYFWVLFGIDVRATNNGEIKTWGIHKIFRRLVPGAASSRGAARMQIVTILGIIVVASFGVARLIDIARAWWARTAVALPLVGLLVLEFAPAAQREKGRWNPQHIVHPAYAWLRDQPGKGEPGVELPWDMGADFRHMYWQRIHQRPIANGWFGFIPEWRLWAGDNTRPNNMKGLVMLRAMGLRWVSVHPGAEGFLPALSQFPWVKPWDEVAGVKFFRIEPQTTLGTATLALKLARDAVEVVAHNPTPEPATTLPGRVFALDVAFRCGDKTWTKRHRVVLEPFWVSAQESYTRRVPIETPRAIGRCTMSAKLSENGVLVVEAATDLTLSG